MRVKLQGGIATLVNQEPYAIAHAFLGEVKPPTSLMSRPGLKYWSPKRSVGVFTWSYRPHLCCFILSTVEVAIECMRVRWHNHVGQPCEGPYAIAHAFLGEVKPPNQNTTTDSCVCASESVWNCKCFWTFETYMWYNKFFQMWWITKMLIGEEQFDYQREMECKYQAVPAVSGLPVI